MPRIPLHPASGTGCVTKWRKTIRLVRYGCTNRPFYHIVVMDIKDGQHKPPIEQVGSYDPLPNKYNEKLVALNLERIQYWLGQNVSVSKPIAILFGLAGFFPIHPRTYMKAWRNRKAANEGDANKATHQKSEIKSEAVG